MFKSHTGAEEITVVAKFSMSGVSGVINFMQTSDFDNLTSMIMISLTGLDQYPSETFPWHIHDYPFTTQHDDPCSAASVGGHFDPFMVGGRPDYSTRCSTANPSLCEVGDLSGKFGNLNPTDSPNRFHIDTYLPLHGVHSIVGRSVVIHRNNGARWVCANIEYPSDVTVAYSPFRANFIGNIFFIEPFSPMGLTTVFTRLSYISGSMDSSSHNWHVHRDPIGGSGDCDDGGPHYNPRGINVDSPDYSNCSPSNQIACEIGDLTGKGSRLNFTNGRTVSFYTDTELPVRVNGLGETILRRSVVVHASNAGAARIACANLIEYTPRVAVARFAEGEVTGQIVFKQSSPFSPTIIRVELSGLASSADGYHVHEFPVDEAIQGSSKCTAAGGHYNPRNIVRNSSSPTTLDAYEIGDLSGKFGGLLGQDTINSSYSDPYLPLFGTESIVGRSVVIHYPNGDRWLCANIMYDMDTLTVTTNIVSDTLRGRLVLTQLVDDPFSETIIFLDFNIGPPVISSSTTLETPTPTQLSTSMTSSQSSSVISPSSTSMPSSSTTSISMLSTLTSTTSILSSSSVLSTSSVLSSTTTVLLSSALSPSPNSTSMTTMSSSTQVTTSITATSDSSSVMTTAISVSSSVIVPTTTSTMVDDKTMSSVITTTIGINSSVIAPTTSTMDDDKTTADQKPSATTTSNTAIMSSASTASTSSGVTPSMTLDNGSGFLLSSSMPTSSPTDKRDDGRKKKDVFKRQMPVLYLSVQSGCEPGASVANPFSASSSCSPTNQLACPIGDLVGKHGRLSSGRNLLTDLNLPLTGPNSSKYASISSSLLLVSFTVSCWYGCGSEDWRC